MLDHIRQDPKIAQITKVVEIKLNPAEEIDVYHNLLASIVSQQLSIKAADTIFERFLNLFPDKYPYPEEVLKFNLDDLRLVGLSRQKATYLQNVADFALNEGITWEILSPKTDQEIIDYLTKIKGVGKWTVEMILMFNLQRPDVFPVDDLGIQQAMKMLYQLEVEGKELRAEMVKIAENWRPYRTLACRYLWKWKDTVKN